PRRPGMAELRAGPEDAALRVEPLPGDAVVIRGAAPGGDPHLIVDLADGPVGEAGFAAEPPGEIGEDLPVAPGLAWRFRGGVDFHHAALEVGGGALVFAPDGRGEDDVRARR